MTTTISPAMRRMRASAGRIFEHFGARLSFRRWAKTAVRLQGSQTWAPTSDVISARCTFEDLSFRNADGTYDRRRVLVVEAVEAFETAPGALTDWRVILQEGDERALSAPPSGIESEDGTYYLFEVQGRAEGV